MTGSAVLCGAGWQGSTSRVSALRWHQWGYYSVCHMVERPRLFVLPPSHYCERARWALDYVALEYQEERLAVGLHIARARSMAEATTLPILTSGRAIIQGSGAILDFVGMAG